jgi:hypothetical protein
VSLETQIAQNLVGLAAHERDEYDPAEQDEILETFYEMLAAVTKDGGKKRAENVKPCWKEDTEHLPAVFSHIDNYYHGRLVDKDSKTHPFVHGAWRMLAIAWQDMKREPWLYGEVLPTNLQP